MDREEAIEVLQKNYPDSCYSMLREAVDMAIEALKTQDRKCETCFHRRGLYCPKLQRTTSDTFFCAYWKEKSND